MDQIPKFDQPPKMKLSGHDQAVMATAQDALATKVYASQLKYFKDDYSHLFLKSKRKMYPIINRGTWARVQAYRQTIVSFLTKFKDCGKPVTVLNLGAGFDTTLFWLFDCHPELTENLVWVEVDYDTVVTKKTQVVRTNESMSKHLINFKMETDYQIESDNYKMFSHDIRNV